MSSFYVYIQMKCSASHKSYGIMAVWSGSNHLSSHISSHLSQRDYSNDHSLGFLTPTSVSSNHGQAVTVSACVDSQYGNRTLPRLTDRGCESIRGTDLALRSWLSFSRSRFKLNILIMLDMAWSAVIWTSRPGPAVCTGGPWLAWLGAWLGAWFEA